MYFIYMYHVCSHYVGNHSKKLLESGSFFLGGGEGNNIVPNIKKQILLKQCHTTHIEGQK